ncbi:unnamed protein product [Nippostrongylus brasiliensis]|uniref:Hydroxysteroid 17-beta dehydrogenase 11 n=1 Tax=Nippostrongylus brasiliensis TaxID=27835 RepID=A0A0N4XXH8_NIPBR|nr:unnamed protein product [Nippostrongylus brasiliensis]
MGRASLPRRVVLAITFVFVYTWCLIFKDIPRVVVITGGAMGIGKAVAKMLSVQEKAKESLNETAAQIRKDPSLGTVDICIVNAAVLKFGECLDLSEKDYKINANVNILGHIFVSVFF